MISGAMKPSVPHLRVSRCLLIQKVKRILKECHYSQFYLYYRERGRYWSSFKMYLGVSDSNLLFCIWILVWIWTVFHFGLVFNCLRALCMHFVSSLDLQWTKKTLRSLWQSSTHWRFNVAKPGDFTFRFEKWSENEGFEICPSGLTPHHHIICKPWCFTWQ